MHPGRRRFRQDPRPHPSHRLAGGRGHRRRRPRPRPHLHPAGGGRARHPPGPARGAGAGGGGHVPRRRLRPASAAVGRPGRAAAGTARPQGGAAGLPPPPHHRTPGPPGRRGHRDRMGQGPHGVARRLRGGRTHRRAPATGARPGHGRSLPALRAGEDQKPPGRLRRPPSLVRHRPRARPHLRRRPTVAVPAPVRRRVPGRQPAPVPAPGGVAGRAVRPVRGGRPQPGHLRLERRRPSLPHRVPGPLPVGRGGAPRRQLPVVTPDPGRGQRRARQLGRRHRRRARAPTGCEPTSPAVPCPR